MVKKVLTGRARRERGEQRIIVAAGRGEQPRVEALSAIRDECVRQRQRVEVDLGRATAGFGQSLGIEQQAVGHVHHRVAHAARAPAPQRAGAPGGDRCRPADRPRLGIVAQLGKPRGRIAERSDQPQRIAGFGRPTRSGTRLAGAADRGQAEDARRAGGKRDRCRRRSAAGRSFRTPPRPRSRNSLSHSPSPADGQRQQAPRPASRPWRRGRTGSPRPASSRRSPAGSSGRKWTPSAMLSWVMTRPSSTRGIVEQPARRRVGRNPPQPLDDLGFAHHSACADRASFAMASSRPLTKPLSRLS